MVVRQSYLTASQLLTELILKTSRVAQPFSNGDLRVALVADERRWSPGAADTQLRFPPSARTSS
jgi:hypothetical protein